MSKQAASTDLIINLPAVMTAEAFTDEQQFESLYSKVKEAVDQHVPDLSTKSGRDAIASLAYKVSRTKTALIGQGKKLTEEWRDKTKKVNASCNIIEQRLDALRDDVRKPLTDWEQAEDKRVNGHKDRLEKLIAKTKTGYGHPSSELRSMLSEIQQVQLGAEHWDEFAPQASVAHQDAIEALSRLLAASEKQEAEAAELERLRAEKAERDRVEAERLAKENAEREAQLLAEREAAAERQRVADAKALEEAEQRRRDADKEHRKTTNNAIVAELIECSGISAEQAQKIVVHMVSGLVPNVTLKY